MPSLAVAELGLAVARCYHAWLLNQGREGLDVAALEQLERQVRIAHVLERTCRLGANVRTITWPPARPRQLSARVIDSAHGERDAAHQRGAARCRAVEQHGLAEPGS